MTLSDAPEVMTVPEVARLLRINRNTAYGLIRRGELYAARIGHAIRVPRTALEQFLADTGTQLVP
jgi:excisionase family DNA binding protein